jgi:hypothetical protein
MGAWVSSASKTLKIDGDINEFLSLDRNGFYRQAFSPFSFPSRTSSKLHHAFPRDGRLDYCDFALTVPSTAATTSAQQRTQSRFQQTKIDEWIATIPHRQHIAMPMVSVYLDLFWLPFVPIIIGFPFELRFWHAVDLPATQRLCIFKTAFHVRFEGGEDFFEFALDGGEVCFEGQGRLFAPILARDG